MARFAGETEMRNPDSEMSGAGESTGRMFRQRFENRWKDRLPWRLRRKVDRLQLWLLRFTSGQRLLPVREGSPSASLAIVGDIAPYDSMGARGNGKKMASSLEGVRLIFQDCDLRIGNLEAVLTDLEPILPSRGSTMKGVPAAVNLLTAAGFDMVSLANNHSRDCRLAGLLECRELLDRHGIRHCGGGSSPEEARSPAILETAGLKVGVLAYCDNFRVDADDAENVAPAAPSDSLVLDDIRALRSRVDLLIVQLHWGWEFSFHPLLSYRERARRFAEAGADLVACHHAHLPLGLEVWKERLIAHGLGNFIFPRHRYLFGGHPWAYRSCVLKVFFDGSGVVRAEIVPIEIDGEGFPRIAAGGPAAEILGGIARASARLLDDAALAWMEHNRTLRDTFSFFRSFPASDPATAHEWALQLRSPCQQDNIRRLQRYDLPAAARLAGFMEQVAASSENPGRCFSLCKESRADGLASAVERLRSTHPIPEDLPGRIP